MAHFIYEYSANLDESLLDMPGLMQKMHEKAVASEVLPLSGIRSRATKYDSFRVADGAADKGFINLSMRVGRGREEAIRRLVGELFWKTLLKHLEPLMAKQPVTCSFEMRELDEDVKFNHRNF